MNTQEIDCVQQSFAGVYARKADLAERFYVHLFTRLPEARAMFRGDFVKQKTMLTAMVTACVQNLDDSQVLEELGEQVMRAHAHLNLGEREGEAAKQAMIAALRDVMAGDLDRETETAWSRAISRVAGLVAQN